MRQLFLAVILSITAALSSCEKHKQDYNDSAFTSYEQLILPEMKSRGGEVKYHFTVTEPWSSTIMTRANSWIRINPYRGVAGEYNITITVDPNEEDSSRSATIKLTAGASSIPVQIKQSKYDAADFEDDKVEYTNLIKSFSKYDAEDNILLAEYNFEYDSNQRVTTITSRNNGGYDGTTVTSYYDLVQNFTYSNANIKIESNYENYPYDKPHQSESFTDTYPINSDGYITSDTSKYYESSDGTFGDDRNITFSYEDDYLTKADYMDRSMAEAFTWKDGNMTSNSTSLKDYNSGAEQVLDNGVIGYTTYKNDINLDITPALSNANEGYTFINGLLGKPTKNLKSSILLTPTNATMFRHRKITYDYSYTNGKLTTITESRGEADDANVVVKKEFIYKITY